ncbi:MAG: hypothetical protein GXP62_19110 [Oligoflexia bacterium]|nr:hypothetical protein [Oligoflexia bacterium]
MLRTDTRFADAVETAVGRIEDQTDAELVIVAAPRSGRYTDIAAALGAAFAWVVLLIVLFSPWQFSPSLIPIELPLVGLLAAWAAHKRPGLLRLLTTSTRRERQVEEAADATFHQEVVHGTHHRTGLLIYLSSLEGRVSLRPDLGLDARVPRAAWNGLCWGDKANPRAPTDLEHFLAGLDAVGTVLAQYVPATGDNPNEIPDAPRIRS